MDDGIAVKVVEIRDDPGLEFHLRGDAEMAEHGARHLGGRELVASSSAVHCRECSHYLDGWLTHDDDEQTGQDEKQHWADK